MISIEALARLVAREDFGELAADERAAKALASSAARPRSAANFGRLHARDRGLPAAIAATARGRSPRRGLPRRRRKCWRIECSCGDVLLIVGVSNAHAPMRASIRSFAPKRDAVKQTFTLFAQSEGETTLRRTLRLEVSWPPSYLDSRRRPDPAPAAGSDGAAVRLRRRDRRIRRNRRGAARGERSAGRQSDHARSGDARSRRHGRSDPHAPARADDAGDRADRAWLDRSGDFGDARRRARFRRQAGRRRAAAGLDQERACASMRSRTNCAARRGATPAN